MEDRAARDQGGRVAPAIFLFLPFLFLPLSVFIRVICLYPSEFHLVTILNKS
jgi:hypothetical protein